MNIEPITNAEYTKVKIHNGTPHCITHGAMNKITKEGIWRCISAHGYIEVKKPQGKGFSISRKEIDNTCNAGCFQVN